MFDIDNDFPNGTLTEKYIRAIGSAIDESEPFAPEHRGLWTLITLSRLLEKHPEQILEVCHSAQLLFQHLPESLQRLHFRAHALSSLHPEEER